ncbi:alpha/beta hydrolase [Actinoplanes hulinensis]|uniref:Alpha/beta hydrolase n=1 Tax=Actinoplanes hulinensis TaxID=1144547 RepID=A0ABS7BDM2_9ACTN|nr:alpha/beta hydrolase [Actinoplanes hulinensis]MBW6439138.1 alpha/beta hydrolase [Actinoplanes hulinensis]
MTPGPGTVIITVPGLRGHVPDHWQTRLADSLANVRPVTPLGRENPRLDERVTALQLAVEAAGEPVVIVAHSAGVIVTVHWAARHPGTARQVRGALLATPPDLAAPLPAVYPSLSALADHGWLPIPRLPLPFPSIVAASSDDPLGDPARVRALADAWGSRHHDLGTVGHLNPASGYGPWPGAGPLINELDHAKAPR